LEKTLPVPPVPFALTNAQSLSKPQQAAWLAFRHALPRSYRILYEGHISLPGLMSFEDRRVIYNTVRRFRPARCFEIGTWVGGGSTVVIAEALRKNGFGRLHTIENEKHVYEKAVEGYDRWLPELKPWVEFHYGDYREVFPPIVEREGGIDFLMLDGAEDGDENMSELEFLSSHMGADAVVAAHDWNTEKCRVIRPFLERSPDWEFDHIAEPPKSGGLAVAVRRRNGRGPERG
jgi:predicted O-methyltransferase YrrM